MLLWVILAVLTVAAVSAVLQPLRRGSATASAEQPALVAVYKDQLAEIDADLERGLIAEDEARAARLEVQRRLLRQSGTGVAPVPAATGLVRRVALVTTAAVPVLAIAAYAFLGSPHLPNQPLSVRKAAAPEKAQVEMLVARVEEQLRQRPEDGRGWEVLAPVYARMGRAQDALDAWRQTIRLQGANPARLRGLVEAALATSHGIVDAEARGALETLRAQDPADPIPRFWLAIGKQQNGERAAAIADFKELLASGPAEAPWRAVVEERLAELRSAPQAPVDARSAAQTSAQTPPHHLDKSAEKGPTAEQMAAAQQMSADDRSKMIAGMVEGLATRLEKDGSDAEGWLRLINAYNVLGRKPDAQSAVIKARAALAKDPPALARISALAKELGL